MIIPTADFDPMFANDGIPFRSKMTAFIKREFNDMLGPDVKYLDSNSGLEHLSTKYNTVDTHEAAA
jgi:hypothetical protein